MRPDPNLEQTLTSNEGLPPLTGWRKTFSALRNVNYRYFYLGQTLSLLGTWTRTAALAWVTFQVTHSEFLLGLVFTLNSLPMLLFSIYAGSLADRFPKIRIFKVTSWCSLLSSSALAVILFLGPPNVGLLLFFAFLWGLSSAFEMPARQTLMVELVGPRDLVNAIALNSAMVNATRVAGPAIGGLLLASVGAPWCFLLDGVSYFAVLYGLHKIRIPRPKANRDAGGLRYTLEGFRHLRENPLLARTVALLLVMSLGGWAYQSQMAAFVHTQLHLDAEGFGWILAMNGLGACVAALLVASMGAALLRERTLYIGIGLYCLFITLLGAQHQPMGAAFFLFFTGFGIILFFSTGNSLIQSHSPNHLRGRLMGIWALVFGGGMPIGSLWMGLVASKTGSGTALQIGGLFCALGALSIRYFFFKTRTPKPREQR